MTPPREGRAPDRGAVLVVCKGDRTLQVLDAGDLRPWRRIQLSGDTGHEVAAAPGTSKAYVPIYGSGVVGAPAGDGHAIDVLDLAVGVVRDSIPLPRHAYPHDVVVRRDGSLIVTCEGRSSLAAVDPATGAVAEVPLGVAQGHMVALSTDERRAWVANVRPGVVVEVDLAEMRATRRLTLSASVNRISLTPDGTQALVADQASPRLAVIDLDDMRVARWVPLPGVAFGTTVSANGLVGLVLRDRSSLLLLDLRSDEILGEVPVPRAPQSVVFNELDTTAYVTCRPADEVIAVDLVACRVAMRRPVGAGADGLSFAARVSPRRSGR